MDFIKIAICDDEKNIRAYLSSLVRKQGVGCEIAEYVSADEYLLDQTEYDLLFLDIELDGAASSMDGMELARRIRGMELEGPPELHTKELCYLCLTPVVGILFGNIIFRLLFTVKENEVFSLYGQYPAFIGLVPLIAALFYTGMVVTVASWQEMVGLQEEKKKYFVEQQQLAAIRERIGEVEQFYDGIRRMKHEMKNHFTNIKGLAGSGSYEEMEQYIARMDESMDAFEMSVRTGNAVTDVIVNDKQKAAEKMGIRFRSDFVYLASDRYNAYDIAIIVNNLLQNALEACGRMTSGERYISLSGSRKNRFFLISVKNSFEGEVIFDKSTNLPVSTKAPDVPGGPAPLHGIGLSNVRREAAKYLGNVDIKVNKNEFSVTVLLQERSNHE